MPAQKKWDVEHKFLARIDNTPEEDKPGAWDRLKGYADEQKISLNDALNAVIKTGMKVKKI